MVHIKEVAAPTARQEKQLLDTASLCELVDK
jgi:hypothetical protein